ncbi:MAG: c-type cytochrome [Adhaeribacter sp.]
MGSRNLLRLLVAAGMLGSLTQCFTETDSEGKQLYTQQCASCHMDDGSGLRSLIPPLAGADYLTKHRDQLPCLIRHGQQGEIVVNGVHYNRPMPASKDLQEVHITNILNYIQTSFGNKNELFTVEEVNRSLQKCRP